MDNLNEVVRENVDNALEQADELLQRAAETTGDEAKELQEKAKKCLLRARGGMKTFLKSPEQKASRLPVKSMTASMTIRGALSVSPLSAACCSVF